MLTIGRRYQSKFLVLLTTAACTAGMASIAQAAGGGQWLSGGQDNHNNRNAATEDTISPANAGDLAVKWVFTTTGDVTANPAVDGSNVYVPDWGGKLYSIDRETGAENWSKNISGYTGLSAALGGVSRSTPVVHGNSLILGGQGGRGFAGARMFSVNKHTGALNWVTVVEEHPAALATQSAVVHGNVVYVGVASNDEGFAAFVPNYPCCSFRGSVLALDVTTGDILWKTYMAPDAATGFSGNAVWGSTPVVDTKRGSVYVTTGNNYSAPDDVLLCVEAAGTNSDDVKACVDGAAAGNHFDSVVALDMNTGAIKWATKALPFDAWTVACIFPIPSFGPVDPDGNLANCPQPSGPDYDFGQGPALFAVKNGNGKPRELLGAGQKSGQYWAVDPDDGSVVWVTQVGTGGVLGGLQWGSATDGKRIYTAATNEGWSALDAATGEILWQTATPNTGWPTLSAVTLANGVVFGGSMSGATTANTMFALDAQTGAILYSFDSGGSVGSGASVVNGTVYWGSGYQVLGPPFAGNNKLYALEVP